jgi:transposase
MIPTATKPQAMSTDRPPVVGGDTSQPVPSDLTDTEWQLVQPFVPVSTRFGNEPAPAARQWLDGMLYRHKHKVPWARVPLRYGSPKQITQRYYAYSRNGVFDRIRTGIEDKPGAARLLGWLSQIKVSSRNEKGPRQAVADPVRSTVDDQIEELLYGTGAPDDASNHVESVSVPSPGRLSDWSSVDEHLDAAFTARQFVCYPLPLGRGHFATCFLPIDLTADEADQLTRLIQCLVIDKPESPEA